MQRLLRTTPLNDLPAVADIEQEGRTPDSGIYGDFVTNSYVMGNTHLTVARRLVSCPPARHDNDNIMDTFLFNVSRPKGE